MYRSLGSFATRHPRCVLLAALGFLVLSLVAGSSATSRLKTQGYDDPACDSRFAARVIAPYQGTSANLVVVVRSRHGGVDAPAARTEGRALTRRLAAQPYVSDVSSYWSGGPARLRGRDGRSALLVAHVDGDGEQLGPRAERVRAALSGRSALTVHVGGTALADQEMQDLAASDLKRAEAVVLPGTLLLLVLVFGSVLAAALPLLIGVLAICGTLLALSLIGGVTDVSVFALNLTTALGLGLGIDYGLLIVSRFREELTAGHEPREAARRTACAAGHTIFFSAATVCAALAALLLFPPYFLRSFAYAGIAVVALAAVAAVTVLPALLALLGPHVNAWAVPWRHRTRAGSASRFWERLARCVVHRPVFAALPVLALLAVLAAPFTHAGFATPDDRALPRTTSSRQAGDLLRGDFDRGGADALTVFFTSSTPRSALDYAPGLSALPGVAEVVGPSGVWRHGVRVAPPGSAATRLLPSGPDAPALFSVVPSAGPHSAAAQRLVRTIRRTPTPADTEIHVGGPSAALVDAKDTIARRLPLAATAIAGTTFLLLFLFSRSLLLPVKAIALNCLSLAAVLGAMVWIFQSGHLRTLLGFTPGPLSTTMPVLLFCVVFGLSVDYEVFVLARIKEAHDAGHDTADAIVTGVARTGGIVTTAGALLAFTLLAFGSSRVSLLQFFGIGAGLGVLLDASLVRGVLVPAFMRLAGGWNWWAPRPFGAGTRTGPPSSGPAQEPPRRPGHAGTPPAHPPPPPPPRPSPPPSPSPSPSSPHPSRTGCPHRAPEQRQVSHE
ncbi:MMPL family transporter [Streptomyces sp. NPDC046881]|uniref:MMPL family transporter n=1 Tax=Streptomyces sp. NPDC046881 TaxID=3155374 RepID=UPI0033E4B98D